MIQAFCEENGIDSIPEDSLDQPFIVYVVAPELAITAESKFSLAVTTRRLLIEVPDGVMLQMDTSHKVSWHNYPVHVLGYSDRSRRLHKLMVGVLY